MYLVVLIDDGNIVMMPHQPMNAEWRCNDNSLAACLLFPYVVIISQEQCVAWIVTAVVI